LWPRGYRPQQRSSRGRDGIYNRSIPPISSARVHHPSSCARAAEPYHRLVGAVPYNLTQGQVEADFPPCPHVTVPPGHRDLHTDRRRSLQGDEARGCGSLAHASVSAGCASVRARALHLLFGAVRWVAGWSNKARMAFSFSSLRGLITSWLPSWSRKHGNRGDRHHEGKTCDPLSQPRSS